MSKSNLIERFAQEAPNSFWEDMRTAYTVDSAIDTVLQGATIEGPRSTSMRVLASRSNESLSLPLPSGTRVKFVASLSSVLSYSDIPAGGMEGTVVKVKTAVGKITHREGRAFVLWDDGKFRPVLAEHLRRASAKKRRANAVRMTVANLGDISGIFKAANGDELIHKATRDLWSFRKNGDEYVIERLFDDDGKPLKV